MATVQKRNNSYKITASCGYDINGKQIRKSITWVPEQNMTQKQITKELERQKILFEDRCRSGRYLDGKIRFADFAERWLTEYAHKQLKPKTVERYIELLKRINLAIGHIKLEELQPIHLLRFYDNLSEEGMRNDISYTAEIDIKALLKGNNITMQTFSEKASIGISTLRSVLNGNSVTVLTAQKISDTLNMPIDAIFTPTDKTRVLSSKTILHHHRLISSIMTTAVQWQLIFDNPCNRVKPPKVEAKEPRYLDEVQTAKMFELLENEPIIYKTAITLLVYTGMRRGELCGLKISDVDFKNKIINIERTNIYMPKRGITEDTTKTTGSKRVIKVSDIALKVLKENIAWQCEQRLLLGDKWINTGYIFTSWNGKPIHPDTLSGWFRDFVRENNLPDICLHSLRHTNASLLIASGVNLTTVAGRLGHANTNTTTKIYAHAIKSADEMAADTLQNILNPLPANHTKKIQ